MKLAAIDIGTNSTRLLAVAIDNAQRAVVVLNDLEITRLGDKMVDGYLNEESMKRTALQVKQFIKQAKGISIDDVVVVATKAVRSAKNKDAFLSYSNGFEIFDYQLEQILNILNNSSHEELSKMPGLDSSRADIILAGVRIISSIVRGLGVKSFTVSETGLLWGVLVKRVKHVENVSMISYLKKHLLR